MHVKTEVNSMTSLHEAEFAQLLSGPLLVRLGEYPAINQIIVPQRWPADIPALGEYLSHYSLLLVSVTLHGYAHGDHGTINNKKNLYLQYNLVCVHCAHWTIAWLSVMLHEQTETVLYAQD
jgi:hypothetical protein